ncbi:hypothetical protein M427DRAFT_66710 [Gonapodya prolifera JEL478]|uniref:Uncharacterized protein n=1 Tax=Gonapodya prolifera (strain JEL478) TaxID=1344416 RepID=A0A139ATV6_GONPJ|nr:hypothetical protein M427DRAFT_66710 [Gonapodya prolifera JEL478]|eukprot:KXS20161.1 hypothetical protein M427DRAFT_66710 [Gonapodya prolifera JEL478]
MLHAERRRPAQRRSRSRNNSLDFSPPVTALSESAPPDNTPDPPPDSAAESPPAAKKRRLPEPPDLGANLARRLASGFAVYFAGPSSASNAETIPLPPNLSQTYSLLKQKQLHHQTPSRTVFAPFSHANVLRNLAKDDAQLIEQTKQPRDLGIPPPPTPPPPSCPMPPRKKKRASPAHRTPLADGLSLNRARSVVAQEHRNQFRRPTIEMGRSTSGGVQESSSKSLTKTLTPLAQESGSHIELHMPPLPTATQRASAKYTTRRASAESQLSHKAVAGPSNLHRTASGLATATPFRTLRSDSLPRSSGLIFGSSTLSLAESQSSPTASASFRDSAPGVTAQFQGSGGIRHRLLGAEGQTKNKVNDMGGAPPIFMTTGTLSGVELARPTNPPSHPLLQSSPSAFSLHPKHTLARSASSIQPLSQLRDRPGSARRLSSSTNSGLQSSPQPHSSSLTVLSHSHATGAQAPQSPPLFNPSFVPELTVGRTVLVTARRASFAAPTPSEPPPAPAPTAPPIARRAPLSRRRSSFVLRHDRIPENAEASDTEAEAESSSITHVENTPNSLDAPLRRVRPASAAASASPRSLSAPQPRPIRSTTALANTVLHRPHTVPRSRSTVEWGNDADHSRAIAIGSSNGKIAVPDAEAGATQNENAPRLGMLTKSMTVCGSEATATRHKSSDFVPQVVPRLLETAPSRRASEAVWTTRRASGASAPTGPRTVLGIPDFSTAAESGTARDSPGGGVFTDMVNTRRASAVPERSRRASENDYVDGEGGGFLKPGLGKGGWRASGMFGRARMGSRILGSRADLGGSKITLAPPKAVKKKKKKTPAPEHLTPSQQLVHAILARLTLHNMSHVISPQTLYRALIPPADTYMPLPNSPEAQHRRAPLWERYVRDSVGDGAIAAEEAVLERERPARWAFVEQGVDVGGDPAHRAMLANERALVVEERVRKRGRMGKYAYRPTRVELWSAMADGEEVHEERAKWSTVGARTRSWWERSETARLGRRSNDRLKQHVRFPKAHRSDGLKETREHKELLRSGRVRDLDEFETFTEKPSSAEIANKVTVVSVPRALSEELWNLEMGRPARPEVVERFLRDVDKRAVALRKAIWFPSPQNSTPGRPTTNSRVLVRVVARRTHRRPLSVAHSSTRRYHPAFADADEPLSNTLNCLFDTADHSFGSGGTKRGAKSFMSPGINFASSGLSFAVESTSNVVPAYQQINVPRYRGGIS